MTTKTTRRVDLIRKISIDAVTNQQLSEVLEITLEEMGKALADGQSVKIPSFGTFAILQKKERLGRNPKTKKDAKISARRVISFKASPVFKKPVANLSI
jgi:integration host factor subunit alpha